MKMQVQQVGILLHLLRDANCVLVPVFALQKLTVTVPAVLTPNSTTTRALSTNFILSSLPISFAPHVDWTPGGTRQPRRTRINQCARSCTKDEECNPQACEPCVKDGQSGKRICKATTKVVGCNPGDSNIA